MLPTVCALVLLVVVFPASVASHGPDAAALGSCVDAPGVVGSSRACPGDHVSEVRPRGSCSHSVGAWLSCPTGYRFAYTWFHRAEWQADNRRSTCWAKTSP